MTVALKIRTRDELARVLRAAIRHQGVFRGQRGACALLLFDPSGPR